MFLLNVIERLVRLLPTHWAGALQLHPPLLGEAGYRISNPSGWAHESLAGDFRYWSVVWNMAFIFPYIGNNLSNWLIFVRGVETNNQDILLGYVWSTGCNTGFAISANQHLSMTCSFFASKLPAGPQSLPIHISGGNDDQPINHDIFW